MLADSCRPVWVVYWSATLVRHQLVHWSATLVRHQLVVVLVRQQLLAAPPSHSVHWLYHRLQGCIGQHRTTVARPGPLASPGPLVPVASPAGHLLV